MRRTKKKVTAFVVQLLVAKGEHLREVVRYDTWDSGLHKHIFVAGEEPRRIDVGSVADQEVGFARDLTGAEAAVREFWTANAMTYTDEVEVKDGADEKTG
jgi:hypothetical protein